MEYIFKSVKSPFLPIKIESDIKIGDLVKVKNYGLTYDIYSIAFLYFWGNKHSYKFTNGIPSKNKLWKVMGLARHSFLNVIVVYIQDMAFNRMVIDLKALTLFKKRNKGKEKSLILQTIKF